MALYQLTSFTSIIRTSDQVLIPADSNNSDYVIYQAWLTSGGVPAPVTLTPQQQFNNVLAAGIITTWLSNNSLNGVYAIDQQTLFNITAETVTILSSGMFSTGGTSRYWLNQAGIPMPMSIAQFKAFAMVVSGYVDSLYAVLAAQQAGQVNTSWPSNEVTINA